MPTLQLAVAAANRRDPDGFRVVQLSVQYDHLHLIVEARDKVSLSSGMRSVAIRIARSVNGLVGRRGRFWADRWHGRVLTSPRQVRTALVYVLANFRKHTRRALAPGIDPFSSGAWFDGWETAAAVSDEVRRVTERAPPVEPHHEFAPVSRPRTWLARIGWRRHGPLRLDEAPAGAPRNPALGP
jgi:putative transposase